MAYYKVNFTFTSSYNPMQAQRGKLSIAVLTLNLSATWGRLVKAMPWPLDPWEEAMVSTAQEPGRD
jgi:hypothetical protein